jgi:hypothetical protein
MRRFAAHGLGFLHNPVVDLMLNLLLLLLRKLLVVLNGLPFLVSLLEESLAFFIMVRRMGVGMRFVAVHGFGLLLEPFFDPLFFGSSLLLGEVLVVLDLFPHVFGLSLEVMAGPVSWVGMRRMGLGAVQGLSSVVKPFLDPLILGFSLLLGEILVVLDLFPHVLGLHPNILAGHVSVMRVFAHHLVLLAITFLAVHSLGLLHASFLKSLNLSGLVFLGETLVSLNFLPSLLALFLKLSALGVSIFLMEVSLEESHLVALLTTGSLHCLGPLFFEFLKSSLFLVFGEFRVLDDGSPFGLEGLSDLPALLTFSTILVPLTLLHELAGALAMSSLGFLHASLLEGLDLGSLILGGKLGVSLDFLPGFLASFPKFLALS